MSDKQILYFRSYGLKGHWEVFLFGEAIGYVAKPWVNEPYHWLMPDGNWSEESYRTRLGAAQAMLKDHLKDIKLPEPITLDRPNKYWKDVPLGEDI